MTARYLRRLQLRETWRITRGFALKQAATDADLARELFFDGALPRRRARPDPSPSPDPSPDLTLTRRAPRRRARALRRALRG